MSEAQQRATRNWKERHNLTRVELLVPKDILVDVDALASERGISRSKFILAAVAQALGSEWPATDDDRLVSIESKLDRLLAVSKLEPSAVYTTGDNPVHTKPKTQGPDQRLVDIVQEYRPKGAALGLGGRCAQR